MKSLLHHVAESNMGSQELKPSVIAVMIALLCHVSRPTTETMGNDQTDERTLGAGHVGMHVCVLPHTIMPFSICTLFRKSRTADLRVLPATTN